MKIPKQLKIGGAILLAAALPFTVMKSLDVNRYNKDLKDLENNKVTAEDQFKAEGNSLRVKIDDTNKEIVNYDGQIKGKRENITQLKNTIFTLEPIYVEGQRILLETEGQIASIEQKIGELELAIEGKKDANEERRKHNSLLETNINQLMTEKTRLEGIKAKNEAYLNLVKARSKRIGELGDFSGYLTGMIGGANEPMIGVRITGYPDFLRFGDFSSGPFISYTPGVSLIEGGDRSAIFAGLNFKWQPVKRFFLDGSVYDAFNNKGRENEPVVGEVALGAGAGFRVGSNSYIRAGMDYLNEDEIFISLGYGKDFDFVKRKK